MKHSLIGSIYFLSVLFACSAEAFEQQELRFCMEPACEKPDVAFVFRGLILKEPLNLLRQEPVKDQELNRFKTFFHRLYEANRNGTKQDVLAIWNPAERKEIDKSVDAKSVQENKARFQALTDMRLKMIIEYSSYYICYVEMTFEGEKSFVMKFPVLRHENNLYLTNKLNGDYFYDNISHLLDKSHYQIGFR